MSRLERALFGGYKRAETDALLSDVADSFEDVWRERGELADRLEDVELSRRGEAARDAARVDADRRGAHGRGSGGVREARGRGDRRRGAPGVALDHAGRARRARPPLRGVATRGDAAAGGARHRRGDKHHGGSGGRRRNEEPPSWPNRENTKEFEAISHGGRRARAGADAVRARGARRRRHPVRQDFAWG